VTQITAKEKKKETKMERIIKGFKEQKSMRAVIEFLRNPYEEELDYDDDGFKGEEGDDDDGYRGGENGYDNIDQNNLDYIRDYLLNPEMVGSKYTNDKEFIKEVSKFYPNIIGFIASEMLCDRAFVFELIKISPMCLVFDDRNGTQLNSFFESGGLYDDPEIKKAALQSWVASGEDEKDFEEKFWKKYIA
jgi:hypothetical protein